MTRFFKKILVLVAMILATSFTVSATAPAPEAQAWGANQPCRYLLGMAAWDCHVPDPKDIHDQDQIPVMVALIAANVLSDMGVLATYLTLGFIIYGGYLYIFSSGDPSKVAGGKKTLTRAFIGLAIVMLSTVILNAIRFALVSGTDFTDCAIAEGSTGCVTDAGSIFTNLLGWFLGTASVVAVIFIVVGAVGYITSAGDSGKLQKAKNTIIYALVGLAIVGLAQIIMAFVSNIIRSSESQSRIETTLIAKELK